MSISKEEGIPTLVGVSGGINSGKDTVAEIVQYLNFRKNDTRSLKIQSFEYAGMTNANRRALLANSSYRVKRFAGKLKQIVALLTAVSVDDLEKESVKDALLGSEWDQHLLHVRTDDNIIATYIDDIVSAENDCKHYNEYYAGGQVYIQRETVKMTRRLLLQLIGTEAGRKVIHPDLWVNALFADYIPIGDNLLEGEIRKVREEDLIYPNWIIPDVRFHNEAVAIKKRGGIIIRVNRKTELRFSKLWEEYSKSRYDSWEDYLVDTGNFRKVYHPSETALDHYTGFDYVVDNNGSIKDLFKTIGELNLFKL